MGSATIDACEFGRTGAGELPVGSKAYSGARGRNRCHGGGGRVSPGCEEAVEEKRNLPW